MNRVQIDSAKGKAVRQLKTEFTSTIERLLA
jgi:hypothetical protein